MLVYGVVGESNHPIYEPHVLPLPKWPARLNGYKLAVLGDLHIRDRWSRDTARKAIEMAVASKPDMVLLVGDYVGYWKPECYPWMAEALESLLDMNGAVVAVPGNHDYILGTPENLEPLFSLLDIHLLRNAIWVHDGIQWAGIDSKNKHRDDPRGTLAQLDPTLPSIILWHEPDGVDTLPPVAALQVSGHSHGGQFRFPGGFTPMHTRNGEKYVRGFFPGAPTPIFVTRGVGTTGPPSRFLCPPEVAILTLVSNE